MLILRAGPSSKQSLIRAAVRILKRGGVAAFPTETMYGLGCDPRQTRAVEKIYAIKGRAWRKPLLLAASSVADARRVAVLDGPAASLGRRYWPGPLTLVLPAKRGAHIDRRVAPHGEVAIRVSSSPFVRVLVRAFGFPLVATSANRSGETECRSGQAVARVFRGRHAAPDVVIDLGSLPRRKPSTLVKIGKGGKIKIVRRGTIRVTN